MKNSFFGTLIKATILIILLHFIIKRVQSSSNFPDQETIIRKTEVDDSLYDDGISEISEEDMDTVSNMRQSLKDFVEVRPHSVWASQEALSPSTHGTTPSVVPPDVKQPSVLWTGTGTPSGMPEGKSYANFRPLEFGYEAEKPIDNSILPSSPVYSSKIAGPDLIEMSKVGAYDDQSDNYMQILS